MSVNQVIVYGVDVVDCPSIYTQENVPGRCKNMIVEDSTIPFEDQQNLILLEASKPTNFGGFEKPLHCVILISLIYIDIPQ